MEMMLESIGQRAITPGPMMNGTGPEELHAAAAAAAAAAQQQQPQQAAAAAAASAMRHVRSFIDCEEVRAAPLPPRSCGSWAFLGPPSAG